MNENERNSESNGRITTLITINISIIEISEMFNVAIRKKFLKKMKHQHLNTFL